MKYAENIVGALLGLLWVASGTVYFLKLIPMPEFPEGTPIAMFSGAFNETGYMHFVKALEILGGILVAFPGTRNLALLVLGPILVNIIAFHTFVLRGEGLFDPVLVVITLMVAFLLWTRRTAFAALLAQK